MPIVTITLLEGRDEETKDRLARDIADVMAEDTGNSFDDIHIIFDDVPRTNWSRALRLASRRAPGGAKKKPIRSDYVSISRVKYDPITEAQYLKLRREVINPQMASHEGFVSSFLLRPHDKQNEYLLVNKWVSKAHFDAYAAGKVHDALREQELTLLPERPQTAGADVVHLDEI